MRILFIGDVVAKAGQRILSDYLPRMLDEYAPDAVIVNGENAAEGAGITPDICDKIFGCGADMITLGNHLMARGMPVSMLDSIDNLLRPCNLAPDFPGRGSGTISAGGKKLGIIVVSGRVFMARLSCPFRAVDSELEALKDCDAVVIEVHAEATSEKMALGWHFSGRCAAIIGTHTHVQTSDERILPGGTAYITDVGMTGPFDSVLGTRKDVIIRRFMTQIPEKFKAAKKDAHISGVLIQVDPGGSATSIRRLFEPGW